MGEAARAFEDHRQPSFLESLPKPKAVEPVDDRSPWVRIHPTSPPPMMLDLQLKSGRILSQPYSSIDFVDMRDAGYLQIGFMGLMPTLITIEGRNLRELRGLLVAGRIRSIVQSDDRDCDRGDDEPVIDKISIEKFVGS
ncbi:MAG TPA: hypothetical protein DDW52_03505 [Planctomycetaceae bacterium]|nr:hypothetical protein [Planctomycetaceae bacterium]